MKKKTKQIWKILTDFRNDTNKKPEEKQIQQEQTPKNRQGTLWNWMNRHPVRNIFLFWWLVALIILVVTCSQPPDEYGGMNIFEGLFAAIFCAVVAPIVIILPTYWIPFVGRKSSEKTGQKS